MPPPPRNLSSSERSVAFSKTGTKSFYKAIANVKVRSASASENAGHHPAQHSSETDQSACPIVIRWEQILKIPLRAAMFFSKLDLSGTGQTIRKCPSQ